MREFYFSLFEFLQKRKFSLFFEQKGKRRAERKKKVCRAKRKRRAERKKKARQEKEKGSSISFRRADFVFRSSEGIISLLRDAR